MFYAVCEGCSSITGYGMKQPDDVLRAYTVAKSSAKVTFVSPPAWLKTKHFKYNDPYDREVKMVKAVLLPGTFHCG